MISEDHVTLKKSNDAVNTEINYSLTHIHIENSCLNLYKYFTIFKQF